MANKEPTVRAVSQVQDKTGIKWENQRTKRRFCKEQKEKQNTSLFIMPRISRISPSFNSLCEFIFLEYFNSDLFKFPSFYLFYLLHKINLKINYNYFILFNYLPANIL